MAVLALTDHLVSFIRSKVQEANASGVVVGISGGLDSAVVLGLCSRACPGAVLGVIMPCYSDPLDKQYALDVIQAFGAPHEEVSLDSVWDSFKRAVDGRGSKLAFGNVKSRLRMITLYHFASINNYLVVGTGNRAEITMGYFTKHGDGGADMLPLGQLTKAEVREVAVYLGVPQQIINRVPTGGLWPGQTDEAEMGVSYNDIDAYIRGQDIDPKVRETIERKKRANEHKTRMPAMPDRVF